MTIELGHLVATPGALDALTAAGIHPFGLLSRHQSGDWGDICAGDKQLNDRAAREGEERILSAYTLPTGTRLWIITEADRSATTLLLPEEY